MNNENGNEFQLLQRDWVQLTPLGDFPHSRGLQRVDRAAVERMAAHFHSVRAKVGRLFGGLPFYAGHPDMPGSTESDRKAYGWIMGLEARADGLHAQVKWSEPGLELLKNGHYKFFSPYWEAEEIGQEGGRRVFRPVALISAGLTNQPNLPVNPLANAQVEALETKVIEPSPGRLALINSAIEEALSQGKITPAEEAEWQGRLANDLEQGRRALQQQTGAMRVNAETDGLQQRREEMAGAVNRQGRLRELVRAQMAQGMSYDDAWHHVKSTRPILFEQLTR